MNEDTLKERERIKKIIERKIEEIIIWREENIRHKRVRNIGMLKRLRDNILFLIDNPDYVRLKDRVEPTSSLLQESVGRDSKVRINDVNSPRIQGKTN